MLASVSIMSAAGNKVAFGPRDEDYFVENIASGQKIQLQKRNGVYVMDVLFLAGEKKIPGQIVVDSGAAECVMPKDFLPEVAMLEKKSGVRFAAANGGEIGNYGRKLLDFVPNEGFSRRA